MPKTVLVFCSNNEDFDFPREENLIMLKKLLGDDYIAKFMTDTSNPIINDRYPEDLPTEENIFDAVLFAGCNVLTWLFKNDYEVGMESLTKILKPDGIVIFIENKKYIKKIVSPGKSYALSIQLEEMKLHPTRKDDTSGLKQNIIQSWNKFFQLEVIYNYFVYKVKEQAGGKYKRKSIHKRKRKSKRKSIHKSKSKHKSKSIHKRKSKSKSKRKTTYKRI
jgi:hypothetical protein